MGSPETLVPAPDNDVEGIMPSDNLDRYLDNPDSIYDLSKEEKARLKDKILLNLDDILERVDVDYSEELCDEVKKLMMALGKIDRTDYRDYEAQSRDFWRAILDSMDQVWEAIQFPTLGDYDSRVRQLYYLMGTQGLDVLTRECSCKIAEVEKQMFEAIHSDPYLISDYLQLQKAQLVSKMDSPEHRNNGDLHGFLSQAEGVRMASENGGWRFYLDRPGESWRIESYSSGVDGEFVAFVSDTNPDKLVVVPLGEASIAFLEGDYDAILARAEANLKSETENNRRLEAYDLPFSGKTQYIRVFPREYNSVVAGSLQASAMVMATLSAHYLNIDVRPPLFTDSPKQTLREEISLAYQNGVRMFVLDINNHGTQDNIAFRDVLTAADLVDLQSQFPEAEFQVNTIACFGGGLREGFLKAFKENPDLKRRFSVFLQSKPDVVNLAPSTGVLSSQSDAVDANLYSTFYNIFLMEKLQEPGVTYGEAAAYADRQTKHYIYNDAEALIRGQLIARCSLRLDSGEAVA